MLLEVEEKIEKKVDPRRTGKLDPGCTHRTDQNENSWKFYIKSLEGGNNLCVHASSNPTGNCQVGIIAMAGYIFSYYDNAKELLKQIYTYVPRKNLMMFDVRSEYLPHIKKLIDQKYILLESLYKSTNGSSMCIMLIETKCLYE
jgi:hypothetical protein